MKKLPYVFLGFILGCVIADWANMKMAIANYHDRYEYGRLIFALGERPTLCPNCGYKNHYLYLTDEDEIQELIDIYMGEDND